jgi:hypothetical protein
MQAIKTGPVAIYARFSTDLQDERSIEDQVRRCREYVKQRRRPARCSGLPRLPPVRREPGAPSVRGDDGLGRCCRIKVIVTEDMSRISRDFADSAQIFKRLQFLKVPLIGVADGIDTSSKHAKLSFTVKMDWSTWRRWSSIQSLSIRRSCRAVDVQCRVDVIGGCGGDARRPFARRR